jgi:hypothetical protein
MTDGGAFHFTCPRKFVTFSFGSKRQYRWSDTPGLAHSIKQKTRRNSEQRKKQQLKLSQYPISEQPV